eukprot:m.177811 g.177811  ORF g.177811 m.177811 type:complete len:77 (-) comp16824_c1_seq7:47-277(-)
MNDMITVFTTKDIIQWFSKCILLAYRARLICFMYFINRSGVFVHREGRSESNLGGCAAGNHHGQSTLALECSYQTS